LAAWIDLLEHREFTDHDFSVNERRSIPGPERRVHGVCRPWKRGQHRRSMRDVRRAAQAQTSALRGACRKHDASMPFAQSKLHAKRSLRKPRLVMIRAAALP
jgi:hypothetical protein